LDYGQCSFLKNPPTNILSWGKNAKLQYIIGLMDAEGSVREDGFVTIRMGSYGVISNIKEILTSIGIESKVRICGKNSEFTPLFGVSFNANEYIVQNSEKFQRLDDVDLRVIDDKSINSRNIRDNSVSKIFNIKKDYTKISFSGDSLFEYVYDITTESSHFYSNGMIQHNCYAGSMGPLVEKGMPFYDKIKINPPKHFDSYINLTLQYICFSSNAVAGAVGLPDWFCYLDFFVRKDYGENWVSKSDIVEHVKQQFQSWIYSVNFSWRSNQSPFTNLSVMDKYWLKNLFENYVFPDYSTPNFDNIMILQKMFTEEMVRNLKNNPFTFPVMTACLLTDPETNKVKDTEFFDWAADIVAKTGLFNIFIDSTTSSLSTCCRLRNDISEASGEFFSSLGSGGVDVGSHRVVTINLPQIAWEAAGDKSLFMKMLEWRVELSQDILDIHRQTLIKLIDNGNLPMYSFGFMNLKKQFSTVGFIGLNESIELMSENITTEAGAKIGHDIIGLINSLNAKRTKLDNNIRNVEQIPGEGAAYNLAQKDAELFTDAKKYPLYSNQFIPLSKEVNMAERIKIQGEYDQKTSGGSILHLNLDSNVTMQVAKDLIEFAGAKGVKYFAINYNFAQCTNCGKVHIGKFIKSPCHAADIKSWIRVVGFLTPTSAWAEPRREEYAHRQFYSDAL
jgi:ribonucleoside-triphosphate reductase